MPLRDVAEGLRALPRLLPVLLRRVPLPTLQRDFYAMLYGLASRRLFFVNKGYAPVDPAMPRLAPLAREPFQASLCHEVLRAGEAALGRPPTRVVEAACGRGGGVRLAAALWPAADLVGFDLQPAAMRTTARLMAGLPACLAVADGTRLPLADGWADLIVSVEGMMSHNRLDFMAEAHRVLAPGGVLAVASTTPRPAAAARELLATTGAERGLELVLFRDIAPAVLEACRLDAPRRLGAMRLAPRPLRRVLEEVATVPGSPSHAALASGARCFYLAVLARRADAA